MGWFLPLRCWALISTKRCKIELRRQLITNSGLSIATKVDDLKRQFTALSSELSVFYACFDQTAEAIESRGFRYEVALYLNYLHIKFDDEIKGNPFEGQAYFPIRLRVKLN